MVDLRKNFPKGIQFFPLDKKSCKLSSSKLFCQKSLFAWNYNFLQILIDTEKIRETLIRGWYFIESQNCFLQAVTGNVNTVICTANFVTTVMCI